MVKNLEQKQNRYDLLSEQKERREGVKSQRHNYCSTCAIGSIGKYVE